MSYELAFPGRILYGAGTRHRLPELLIPGNVVIVTGNHSRERVERELASQLSGRTVELISDIHPESPLADVERVLASARGIAAELIIGWGGGSAIDTAKSAAALRYCDGNAADYFYGKRKICGKRCFFAALPTTAGTGAEVTPNAVHCDPETGIKQSIRHSNMFADIAIVDPELTYDCPPEITAASGFDALTQAIESYISRKASTPSKTLAMQAAKNIFPSLHPAWQGEHSARDFVSEGSMLAGMALAQSGLGAVHGIGHPLGSILHVPHGVCCAILLPTILKWNLPACHDAMEDLSLGLINGDPETLIDLIAELRGWLGLPENFKKYGLEPKHFDFIVKHCRSGSMKSNPRDLSDDEVREILTELL